MDFIPPEPSIKTKSSIFARKPKVSAKYGSSLKGKVEAQGLSPAGSFVGFYKKSRSRSTKKKEMEVKKKAKRLKILENINQEIFGKHEDFEGIEQDMKQNRSEWKRHFDERKSSFEKIDGDIRSQKSQSRLNDSSRSR